ncbi:MAG: TPM domain-containing protein, partial [Chitinophagaceae bacterium]
MKKLLFILTLLISVCSFAQIEKVVPKKPNPPKLINDYTNTLTDVQKQALEDKLVAYDDSTSNQIAIVIIPTTGNYSVEEVALEILRTWGVGNKDINNGIVLLVAKDDRKMRIEVGYGLEGVITDVTSKDIIEYAI